MTRPRIYDPAAFRSERERLLHIVAGSLSERPLKRSDGRSVRNYVQGHLVLGDPVGLRLACSLMLEAMRETSAGIVAGEVSAACALVSGIVTLSGESGHPVLGRYLRKAPRSHGVPSLLSAPLPASSDIFLVDDVSATGTAGERCTHALRSLGHRVGTMMVVVDRSQGAAERLAHLGVELWTLFTLDEVRSSRGRAWWRAANG